ncbi:uncharacterized protein LOC124285136 isoform X1 [Haliotis rubra]|uniref:uncharacterized protein LOC124285136 isoform X1 n=1 Tax=Haliotis rubra TaxID=36100 RepID=UPI001EE59EF4|nr:uncharacterized protein LOC124285136 isoform X1 [Haliotis rubra]
MKWTLAIRIFALLCITQTTTAFLSERTRCTFVDIITCWFNPCRSSVCPLYPQARCSLLYLRCGCRAVWHTSFGQVNCNGPPRIRLGHEVAVASSRLPAPAVRVAPSTPVVQRVVPERRQLPQNDCPPEVMHVRCRDDPCMRTSCRSMPDAVCRPNYCGGCMAEFFREGMRVQCGRTSFPELIDPASVMVKDRSAYTNSKGRQPPPIIPAGPDPFTQVPGPAPGWTGPQVLQPSPSLTQPPSPWTDGTRITQVTPRSVATGPRVFASSVSSQSTVPQNSRSQSRGDAALALQQNVFGLGALFPDENTAPQVSSASQPGGPLPTNSMDRAQNNFGSQGQTGQESFSRGSGVVPPSSFTTTAGTAWQARQGQGQNNLAAWRARSGATGSTLVPAGGQSGVVRTSLGPLPSQRGLFVPTTAETCPAGTSPAICSSHPCANQTCHIPGATCIPNACGSCFARWYLDGQEVDCSGGCTESQITVACPRNPCAVYSCPAHPDAVCRYSKCGSCRAQWFIGNREVKCDIPWSASPCPQDQKPTCSCFYNHCQTDRQARCRVTGCGSDCGTEFYKVNNNSIVIVDCPVQKGQWSRNPQ